MNKIQLNNYIRGICNQIPVVHSFYTNDVYECWNAEEVKYGSVSFVITDASVGENTTTWTAMLYFADRLMEDGKNRDEIQTDAVNVINSLMNTIYSDDTILTLNYPTQITLFEQKFMDYLAGGYATVQIGTDNSVDCGYGYVSIGEGCAGKINELTQEIVRLEGELVQSAKEYEEFIKELNNNHQLIVDGLEETINEKEDEIEDLNETIEQLREGGIDFSSIGYDENENKLANEGFKNDLKRSQELLEYWESGNRNTDGFKDVVYAPMWNMVTHWAPSKSLIFTDCKELQYVPLYDFSTTTDVRNLFSGCSVLKEIPKFDTSNVTNMNNMFYNCLSLTSIPLLDTSKVTSMNNMFYDCKALTTIPPIDTSKVTNMNNMFYGCYSLTTIPPIDTSKVTNMTAMFSSCSKLESLPLLDFSSYDRNKTTNFGAFFGYSNITTLTDLGGFKNFCQNWTGSGSLKYTPNLTVQSLLNVFNTIGDVNDLGGRKLEIGTTNLNKLTDDQKQIAINKGWTLS